LPNEIDWGKDRNAFPKLGICECCKQWRAISEVERVCALCTASLVSLGEKVERKKIPLLLPPQNVIRKCPACSVEAIGIQSWGPIFGWDEITGCYNHLCKWCRKKISDTLENIRKVEEDKKEVGNSSFSSRGWGQGSVRESLSFPRWLLLDEKLSFVEEGKAPIPFHLSLEDRLEIYHHVDCLDSVWLSDGKRVWRWGGSPVSIPLSKWYLNGGWRYISPPKRREEDDNLAKEIQIGSSPNPPGKG